MRIEFIELCGFRGFREKVRLDIAPGFAVISGRNGVGKSTLCDAIEFAITGTIDKYRVDKAAKETLNDYVWWRGRGSAAAHYVSVGFHDEEGTRFELTRSREGGANHDTAAIEDALCAAGARPEKVLQQLCRTSIIRDEWIAGLSLDLSETERFDFVHAALGAVERSDYTGKARDVASGAEAARAAAEQVYEDARTQVNQALVELAETRDIAMRAGDIAAAMEGISSPDEAPHADLASRIVAARKGLAERHIRLNAADRLREEIATLTILRTEIGSPEFEAALAAGREAVAAAEAEAAAAESAAASAEARLKAVQEADRLAASLAALIEQGEHVGLHDGHCPLCAAARTQAEFHTGLAVARTRLASFGSSAGVVRQQLADARKAIEATARRLSDERRKLDDLVAKREALARRQATLAAHLKRLGLSSELGDPAALDASLEEERNRLVDLERRILTLEASQAVERITTLEARVTELRHQADALADRLAQAQTAVAAAKALDRAVRRTNAEIIDEHLAIISPLLSELYQRLRPHTEWRSIEYSIRGDVKRFLSLKVGDNLNPQFVFSSGQRRAAGLAFLLSVHLSRPWCRWQTLVLDDPVQHIDDFRALHLAEVLSVLSQSGRQIVCAVEDPALAELLCRRLLSTATAPGLRHDLALSPEGFATVQRSVRVEPMSRGTISSTRPMAAAG